MDNTRHLKLTLWLAREVARLHGLTSSLREVVEEARIVDPRLQAVDAAQVEIDSLQEFYDHLVALDPELAELIDNRTLRAFGTQYPDEPFPQ